MRCATKKIGIQHEIKIFRRFKCNMCPSAYYRKHELAKHIDKKHPNKEDGIILAKNEENTMIT